ncbi:MAG TPA: restriction endonuclease subunit S [Gammaproteobacteria bacterium]|nr:restriction endonuclease subunit S [Gammaproteobacteria bacterium]
MTTDVVQVRKLPDVVFFQEGPGLRAWQWTEEGMKVINGTNILLDGTIDVSNTDKFISQSEFEARYRHFEISDGDIVLSSSGTLGKVARIRAEHLPLMMNTSVIRFCSKDPETLHDGYLFAFLRSPLFQALIRAFAVGGVQQNFGPVHLKQIEIPIPPLHLQRGIADILSAYDDLIENNRRRMALLEDAARQLYREWFVRLRFPGHEHTRITNGVPEGWERCTVANLLAKIEAKPRVPKEEYLPDGPIPCVDQSAEFIGGYTENTDAAYSAPLPIVVFGDHTRTLKYVDFEFARGADGTQLIFPNDDRISTEYLYLALKEIDLSNYFYARHFKYLKVQEIFLPKRSLVQEFGTCAKSVFEQISTLRNLNRKLRAARDLLLPRLMSGEIAV